MTTVQLEASHVKVLKIERSNHPRIKATATIQLEGVGTLSGMKVIEGTKGIYCVPPNQCYIENGLKVWMNLITFEKYLWDIIQEKILAEYEQAEREGIDKRYNL